MNYRRFFAALAAALIASGGAYAQAPARSAKPVHVAIFFTSPPKSLIEYEKTFVSAMRELGWVEGSTVVYDRAYASRELRLHDERRAHAAALVSRKPDVIWLLSTVNARAVQDETR